jgi:hypothetical protein
VFLQRIYRLVFISTLTCCRRWLKSFPRDPISGIMMLLIFMALKQCRQNSGETNMVYRFHASLFATVLAIVTTATPMKGADEAGSAKDLPKTETPSGEALTKTAGNHSSTAKIWTAGKSQTSAAKAKSMLKRAML